MPRVKQARPRPKPKAAPRATITKKFVEIRADEIQMAPIEWGRSIEGPRAERYAAMFDPDKFGVPAIWVRPDLPVGKGRYVVLDGQHRITAVVVVLGWESEILECQGYYNLTDARAAEISEGLQDRRNLHVYDKFRIEVVAGKAQAVSIQDVVDRLEIALAKTSHNARTIVAIDALRRVHTRLGDKGLERVLSVLIGAWHGVAGSLSSELIRMVGMMVAAHGDQLDDKRLSRILGSKGYSDWLMPLRFTGAKQGLGHVVQEAATIYNSRLAEHNKLEVLSPTGYSVAFRKPPTSNGGKRKAA